jgi:hypothetical protein
MRSTEKQIPVNSTPDLIVMKMKTGSVLFTWLLFATVNVFSQDTNFYIFLCFGQSNMEGFPGVEEQDKTTSNRLQVLAAVDFPNMGRQKGVGTLPSLLCAETLPVCAPQTISAGRWFPNFPQT